MKHYNLSQLQNMPTLLQGHTDNLKVETDNTRIWISRMTKEDGQPYDNQVTVETLVNGRWEVKETYQAK